MGIGKSVYRWVIALAVSLVGVWASPAMAACTVTPTYTQTYGTYSPAAVKGGVIPALGGPAGISCPNGVLVVLSGTTYFLKATFSSANYTAATGLVLKSSAGATVGYTASTDAAGAYPFTQSSTTDYMQNNLLNLLGLLGGSNVSPQLYIKPKSTALVAAGTYSDVITVTWNWNLCTGLGVGGLCLGLDKGSAKTTAITVKLLVAAETMTMVVTSAATWDPLNGTTNPKALPGSKRRITYTVANPDLVALDQDAIAINIPTSAGTTIALDGDGSGSGSIVTFTDGSTASALTLNYASASSASDDVDFSSDGGSTWTFQPTAGDALTQSQVTNVRLRPKGKMAASSSFSVSLPYSVK